MSRYTNDLLIESAIRILCEYAPSDWDRPKRLLMHDLRVGFYLYEHDYSVDVVVAGFLHDVLEWTDCDESLVRSKFGDQVFEIVSANTKDRSISDPHDRRVEYVQRCLRVGEDALIVKAVDTLDSYKFYVDLGDESEIERSRDIARIVLDVCTQDMKDPIFKKLNEIVN
ncbi:MAG: hypothetical protein CMI52_05090 [Parcubacteria group bacterium]|nr:hypothetical protein [Parcubacteria group bacterium]|tara:strand:+ start:1201 stop:1707 length:507 start_codon:yes stop_codon:yes gene_type:complete